MEDGSRRTGAPLALIPGGHLPMLSHPVEAAEAIAAVLDAWA